MSIMGKDRMVEEKKEREHGKIYSSIKQMKINIDIFIRKRYKTL